MTSWAMLTVEMLSGYMSEMTQKGIWQERSIFLIFPDKL